MSYLSFKPLRSIIIASATAAMMTSAFAAGDTPPASARQLSAVELFQLFGNRTWVWDNGGAFFQSRKRSFRAYSNGDGDRTSAEGRWYLTDAGRLCLHAEWRTATGDYEDLTCFRHVQSGRTIYQRKEDGGDWYVLVENGKLPETLVSGDILSSEYSATQQAVLAARR